MKETEKHTVQTAPGVPNHEMRTLPKTSTKSNRIKTILHKTLQTTKQTNRYVLFNAHNRLHTRTHLRIHHLTNNMKKEPSKLELIVGETYHEDYLILHKLGRPIYIPDVTDAHIIEHNRSLYTFMKTSEKTYQLLSHFNANELGEYCGE